MVVCHRVPSQQFWADQLRELMANVRQAPVCLVKQVNEELTLCEEGIEYLNGIRESIAVICVAGQYR